MIQKRDLRIVALILAVVLLLFGVWYIHRTNQKDKQRIDDLYAMVEPLQQQREELAHERDGMDAEYAFQMKDSSTIELLFRELDVRIFSDIYPRMRDKGIIGVLGVSPLQVPGMEGKLSVEEYSRLMVDGWGTCLVYEQPEIIQEQPVVEEEHENSEEEEVQEQEPIQPQPQEPLSFADWYSLVSQDLLSKGFQMPTVIYFPNNDYDSGMDTQLLSYGINTVIVPVEDAMSIAVEEVSEGIWHTGAMPWNYTGITNDLSRLEKTDGGNVCFTISFSDMWDAYEEKGYDSLLDHISSKLGRSETASIGSGADSLTPFLENTDIHSAREMHKDKQSRIELLKAEFEQKKNELDGQIAQLDTQIRQLYDQWNGN